MDENLPADGAPLERQVRRLRGFCLGIVDHPTVIDVYERDDGGINFALVTKRDTQAPLITRFGLSPKTFGLLHDALLKAAHDQT